MKKIILYINTVLKLGLWNVTYVIWYRFSLRSGIRKLKFPAETIKTEKDYFLPCKKKQNYPVEWKKDLLEDADKILSGTIRYYAYHWKNIGNPPNWFLNPFNGKYYPNSNSHWTKLPDFHPEVGDIKNVWEASRFEWVITLARAYAVTEDQKYLETLNKWLKGWSEKNPLNIGPNWKCGQEASIRVFNLLNASFILNQYDKASDSLKNLIYLHLKRIQANILYAIAQNNNHGTSEAAALFIGGNWLRSFGESSYPKSKTFARSGKKWLENRIKKLVAKEGSFSQHSVNYHRVMLDTLCFAEFWRAKLNLKPFSELFYKKANAASAWLLMFTDEISGNVPNIGANDGAMLLNSHSCNYRNFKPSVQLSYIIFDKTKIYDEGKWDEQLLWFEINSNEFSKKTIKRNNKILDNSYAIFKNDYSWGLIRLPCFKFRPSHNDIFHFDLWHNGKNIICDAGSYSYNPAKDESDIDFKSVHFHNTASFDQQNQMPRLSRFLLANWIKPDYISEIKEYSGDIHWEGSYTDSRKNKHHRILSIKDNIWKLEDYFSGDFNHAYIGFNFKNENLALNKNKINTSWGDILIKGSSNFYIKKSYCSDYYWEKHLIERLIIIPDKSNHITTKFFINT